MSTSGPSEDTEATPTEEVAAPIGDTCDDFEKDFDAQISGDDDPIVEEGGDD